MPIISRIEQQKKLKNRYNLYLKNNGEEFFAMGISEDTLVRFQLSAGKEMTASEFDEIQNEDEINKGFNVAANYISFKLRSEKEVRKYMLEKEFKEEVVEQAIEKLKTYKYINDEMFAESYTRNEMNVSRKGPKLIRRELFEKGITEKACDEALSHYEFHLQVENATKWTMKQFAKQKTSARETEQKTRELLVRKGFTSDVITEALATIDEPDETLEFEKLCKIGVKYYKKYKDFDDYNYKNKMRAALHRKGFNGDLINQFLSFSKEQIDRGDFYE